MDININHTTPPIARLAHCEGVKELDDNHYDSRNRGFNGYYYDVPSTMPSVLAVSPEDKSFNEFSERLRNMMKATFSAQTVLKVTQRATRESVGSDTPINIGDYMIRSVQINEKKKVVTIVWYDGGVTLAKCGPNDIWDPEKGFYVAFTKRFFASTTQMNKIVKKETEK